MTQAANPRRITEAIRMRRSAAGDAVIPYVTAGFPTFDATRELLLRMCAMDIPVIELGVPFSDPIADGPVIQAASQAALENGASVARILELVVEVRARGGKTAVMLFNYLNPLLSFGVERLAREAPAAGIDGLLVCDLPAEKLGAERGLWEQAGMAVVPLVAPTTSDARMEKIANAASGFVYVVSRAGVTGAQKKMTREYEPVVEKLRQWTDLPVGVGFGISSRRQVAEVCKVADAAVVGSALVQALAVGGVAHAEKLMRELTGADGE